MQANETVTFRMQSRTVAAWVVGALFSVTMGVQAALSSAGVAFMSVLSAALCAVLCWRFGRARIECNEKCVLIVNTFYKRQLKWSDIDRFDFNLNGLNPWVAFAVRKDGKRVTIAAIQGAQYANPDSKWLQKPRSMVNQLNALLQSRT
jgi:hypothetical protein